MVLLITIDMNSALGPSSHKGQVWRFLEKHAPSFRQPTESSFLVETDQDAWWWQARLSELVNPARHPVCVWELAPGNHAVGSSDTVEWLEQRLSLPAAPSDVAS